MKSRRFALTKTTRMFINRTETFEDRAAYRAATFASEAPDRCEGRGIYERVSANNNAER